MKLLLREYGRIRPPVLNKQSQKTMKRLMPLYFATILTPVLSFGTTIVDDTFQDGRNNLGSLQADWWYSTSSTAIETSSGILGLVTGTYGRGIHGTYASQSLGIGDILTASFTFTTPATVATAKPDSFKIG